MTKKLYCLRFYSISLTFIVSKKKPTMCVLKLVKSAHLISLGNIPNNQCLTTNDSPDKNAQCKLPFKFNGVLRQECITDTDPDGRYWCSTKVDENLEHIRFPNGYWGYCDQSCPPLISTESKQQGMLILHVCA